MIKYNEFDCLLKEEIICCENDFCFLGRLMNDCSFKMFFCLLRIK